MSIESLIKATGPEIADDYDSLSEKLIDYFELVKEYDRNKLFVLLNLRSFLAIEELQTFINEVLMRNIQILLIDSREYPLLEKKSDISLTIQCVRYTKENGRIPVNTTLKAVAVRLAKL